MERGRVVLVDTNIIIEAFRTGSWNAVVGYFAVETVEKCYEEALTGDPLRPGYTRIDPTQLRNGLRQRHAVSNLQRAGLALNLATADVLDAGERDLFAHMFQRDDAWLASCADRAALNVALDLGWEKRIVALERLAKATGARPALKHHFTERWLSEVRTAYKLDKGLK